MTVDVKPTNRKPPGKAESPAEPFKRALASCTRAMARRPDLEVAFAADKPALVSGPEGARARLRVVGRCLGSRGGGHLGRTGRG